jgi:hypothetical protein
MFSELVKLREPAIVESFLNYGGTRMNVMDYAPIQPIKEDKVKKRRRGGNKSEDHEHNFMESQHEFFENLVSEHSIEVIKPPPPVLANNKEIISFELSNL